MIYKELYKLIDEDTSPLKLPERSVYLLVSLNLTIPFFRVINSRSI